MIKNKNPIIIANWKDNVSTMAEIKKLLTETNKEYLNLNKIKYKTLKKKPLKKPLSFYLSVPTPFIYGIQEFLKKNTILKKIIIGAQNFDSISKQNQNNNITLSQIKNINSKFIILNSNLNFSNINSQNKNNKNIKINKDKEIKITHNLILDRLNAVSKKFKDEDNQIEINNTDLFKIEKELRDKNFKQIENLNEKLNSSLANKLGTLVVLNELPDDLQFLTNLIKNLIKNTHYNLFNNLMICYQDSTNNYNNIRIIDIENCQEKAITIRRAIANLFGIDNAKKVKIIYEGEVDSTNILDLLEQGGVDGVLLNEESLKPKFLAKILSQIS